LIASSLISGPHESPSLPVTRPVWEIDLRSIGSTVPTERRYLANVGSVHHWLVFLTDETLAVTFIAGNQQTGITTKQQPGSPYVLKTASIDSQSGAVQRTKMWGNSGDIHDLVALEKGHFAVLDRSGVSLYSETLEQTAQIKHEPDTAEADGPSPDRKMFPDLSHSYWSLAVSPTRKTLALVHSGAFTAVVRRLNPVNLEMLGEFKQTSILRYTISDDLLAYIKFDHKRGVGVLHTRQLTGADRDNVSTLDIHNCSDPVFANNEMLVITGGCSYLLIANSGGHQLIERRLANSTTSTFGPRTGQRMASGPLPSVNGRRLAVTEFAFVEGSSWRDRGPRSKDIGIVVYDLQELSPVFSFPEPDDTTVMRAYALSPSGELLAILRDNKLTVYRVSEARDPRTRPAR